MVPPCTRERLKGIVKGGIGRSVDGDATILPEARQGSVFYLTPPARAAIPTGTIMIAAPNIINATGSLYGGGVNLAITLMTSMTASQALADFFSSGLARVSKSLFNQTTMSMTSPLKAITAPTPTGIQSNSSMAPLCSEETAQVNGSTRERATTVRQRHEWQRVRHTRVTPSAAGVRSRNSPGRDRARVHVIVAPPLSLTG